MFLGFAMTLNPTFLVFLGKGGIGIQSRIIFTTATGNDIQFFSGQLAIQSAFGHYIQQLFVSYTQYIIKVFHLPA